MDLRTVKHFIWKSGGDLTLHYRQKSTWKSSFLQPELSFANHHPPPTCSTLYPIVWSRVAVPTAESREREDGSWCVIGRPEHSGAANTLMGKYEVHIGFLTPRRTNRFFPDFSSFLFLTSLPDWRFVSRRLKFPSVFVSECVYENHSSTFQKLSLFYKHFAPVWAEPTPQENIWSLGSISPPKQPLDFNSHQTQHFLWRLSFF